MTVANDLVHPDSARRRYNLVRVRANYTARVDDLVAVLTSIGAFTVTLPASASSGACVAIADDSSLAATNAITVVAAAAIDGAPSITLAQNDQIAQFMFDGTTWKQLVIDRLTSATDKDISAVRINDIRKAIQ